MHGKEIYKKNIYEEKSKFSLKGGKLQGMY